jgi:hypothetical protein
MKRGIAWGIGKGPDGEEAGQQAIQQALNNLGSARPVLAIMLVSHEFAATDVLAGVVGFLGNTPIWGFCTSLPMTKGGVQPRSVIVALLSGNELKVKVNWLPGYVQDSAKTIQQVRQLLSENEPKQNGFLLVADGVNGDASQICAEFQFGNIPLGEGLAAYILEKLSNLAECREERVHCLWRSCLGASAWGSEWEPAGKTSGSISRSTGQRGPGSNPWMVFRLLK